MKKLLSKAFSLPIHPLLIAVFPIIFLYAQNPKEATWDQLLVPIAVSVLAAIALWMACMIVLRDKSKAALAASLVIFGFFSYGRFYDLLGDWNVAFLHRHNLLIPLVILVCGYAVYFVSIAHWNFRIAARVLNIVASALIVLNLGTILFYSAQGVKGPSLVGTVQAADTSVATDNLSVVGAKPDIYYIILDEYAHPSTMAEFYDYDDTGFTDFLVDRGFFVASKSRVWNNVSVVCIASNLNLGYIPEPLECKSVYEKINKNKVMDFLKSNGYKSVYFGNWYDIGKYKVPADITYNFYSSGYNEVRLPTDDFSDVLLNTTMVRAYSDYMISSQYESFYRRGLIDTLDQLQQVPTTVEGPKFVFAHILCPHQPFVCGPRGETVDYADYYNWKNKQLYLGQYIFISEQIQRVLDSLIAESEVPPIIIVQSDHGLRDKGAQGLGLGTEWQKILNAYYLPGDASEQLYDSISPVNSFRFIFNCYFGTDYALWKD